MIDEPDVFPTYDVATDFNDTLGLFPVNILVYPNCDTDYDVLVDYEGTYKNFPTKNGAAFI